MRRQLAAIPVVLILASAPAQLQVQNAPGSAGANVQVSASKPATMHGEGLIVADPTEAKRLLVCSMVFRPDVNQGIVVYASHDGGQHWALTFETDADDGPSGDPACAFGPDGTAYLTFILLKADTPEAMRLPLYRSADGGRTWRAEGATGGLDRESIVVDRTGGRFHNRIYIHGATLTHSTSGLFREALQLFASGNGGKTFGRPAEVVALGREYIFGPGNSVVLSDGRWVAAFGNIKAYFESADNNVPTGMFFPAPPEPENAWLRVVWSEDGGDSLAQPVTVSGWHMPNPYVRQSMASSALAADATNGPFRDRLYIAWPDTRFGGTDILFSYSADRGRTWAPPIVINDDRRPVLADKAPNHLTPAIAVNKAGVVAVTWLDRRDQPDNLGWCPRVRASLDGGETFLPSATLSGVDGASQGRGHGRQKRLRKPGLAR
jgi:hypothetical protein